MRGILFLIEFLFKNYFQVWVEMEKSGDDLHMNFPITIATCPFRIPNSNQQPKIEYGKHVHSFQENSINMFTEM